METKNHSKPRWLLAGLCIPPILLIALFAVLKEDQDLMDQWVFGIAAPFEQALGRFWSLLPFSVAEVLAALSILLSVSWLFYAGFGLARSRAVRRFFRQLLALLCVWSWLLACFNWLWNAAYYTSSFSERSQITAQPYSVDDLAAVTCFFAQEAARLSTQVPRDDSGHFSIPVSDCFSRGITVYDTLEKEFPILEMDAVAAKPLFASRLQSILGFTGVYFPFTGEANVNVDAPRCLIPATIAHEMAHQRMISSELEANFIGIAACTTCSDPVFCYSGYLMGLIALCNALYPVAPDLWYAIAEETFTVELSADWNDNNEYWAALESPVEEAAEDAYDTFLKQNDQTLGIRSYGACVDLLVAYYFPKLK